ncbi:hypothetical protein CAQU_04325 [Corynebacterium aquilae DSM 44791]|uniref:Uncharacterized protein n=1 Tax=Corynebacterium aquilae DSM 44791 TaxID=1431546 RepID=A0A1L7CEW7_9CORY|nr:hypothetical protein CAQU_04325 [Corynebacterium aquilae DSM 44791]
MEDLEQQERTFPFSLRYLTDRAFLIHVVMAWVALFAVLPALLLVVPYLPFPHHPALVSTFIIGTGWFLYSFDETTHKKAITASLLGWIALTLWREIQFHFIPSVAVLAPGLSPGVAAAVDVTSAVLFTFLITAVVAVPLAAAGLLMIHSSVDTPVPLEPGSVILRSVTVSEVKAFLLTATVLVVFSFSALVLMLALLPDWVSFSLYFDLALVGVAFAFALRRLSWWVFGIVAVVGTTVSMIFLLSDLDLLSDTALSLLFLLELPINVAAVTGVAGVFAYAFGAHRGREASLANPYTSDNPPRNVLNSSGAGEMLISEDDSAFDTIRLRVFVGSPGFYVALVLLIVTVSISYGGLSNLIVTMPTNTAAIGAMVMVSMGVLAHIPQLTRIKTLIAATLTCVVIEAAWIAWGQALADKLDSFGELKLADNMLFMLFVTILPVALGIGVGALLALLLPVTKVVSVAVSPNRAEDSYRLCPSYQPFMTPWMVRAIGSGLVVFVVVCFLKYLPWTSQTTVAVPSGFSFGMAVVLMWVLRRAHRRTYALFLAGGVVMLVCQIFIDYHSLEGYLTYLMLFLTPLPWIVVWAGLMGLLAFGLRSRYPEMDFSVAEPVVTDEFFHIIDDESDSDSSSIAKADSGQPPSDIERATPDTV